MACISEGDTREPQKWLSPQANFDLIYLTYSKSLIFQKCLISLNVPVYQVNSGKWKNIKSILVKFGFGKYEYFWFPDCDLEIEVEAINRLFKIAEHNQLELCQPALTHDSFYSHDFLCFTPSRDQIYRPVKMVEIMCPCFPRFTLGKLLWTFDLSFSGYGLDHLWAKYVQGYVIDAVTVKHPRPQNFHNRAKLAGFPNPDDELKMIREKYL
jgi:hypothetical protein